MNCKGDVFMRTKAFVHELVQAEFKSFEYGEEKGACIYRARHDPGIVGFNIRPGGFVDYRVVRSVEWIPDEACDFKVAGKKRQLPLDDLVLGLNVWFLKKPEVNDIILDVRNRFSELTYEAIPHGFSGRLKYRNREVNVRIDLDFGGAATGVSMSMYNQR
jgi:hypothetical protein